MSLNAQAIKPMTLEQMMHSVYSHSADTQLRVLEAPDSSSIHFSVTFTYEVPIEMARKALDSYKGAKIVKS